MIFIDYLTVMLVNMVAGLLTLAVFLGWGMGGAHAKAYAAPFAAVGLVALLTGLHMTLAWPLPAFGGKNYNVLFGETTLLLAAAFLAMALTVAMEWSLAPIGVYAAVGGALAILLGIRVINLQMTQAPTVSGIGFILTGGAAVLLAVCFLLPANRPLRCVTAAAFILAALLWAFTGGMSYWMHMHLPGTWMPRDAQKAEPPAK